jgi:hypothetical protein
LRTAKDGVLDRRNRADLRKPRENCIQWVHRFADCAV